ncbi:hypothetical protein JB92DRAFT_1736833 [Gautieria morchelliformis]|nr:hypothetical protein JB92DRAFT_1736833 [Gautieria morchelliformis]
MWPRSSRLWYLRRRTTTRPCRILGLAISFLAAGARSRSSTRAAPISQSSSCINAQPQPVLHTNTTHSKRCPLFRCAPPRRVGRTYHLCPVPARCTCPRHAHVRTAGVAGVFEKVIAPVVPSRVAPATVLKQCHHVSGFGHGF